MQSFFLVFFCKINLLFCQQQRILHVFNTLCWKDFRKSQDWFSEKILELEQNLVEASGHTDVKSWQKAFDLNLKHGLLFFQQLFREKQQKNWVNGILFFGTHFISSLCKKSYYSLTFLLRTCEDTGYSSKVAHNPFPPKKAPTKLKMKLPHPVSVTVGFAAEHLVTIVGVPTNPNAQKTPWSSKKQHSTKF